VNLNVSESAMQTLLAISAAQSGHITTNHEHSLWLEVGGRLCPVGEEDFDELNAAGLLDMSESDRVTITDKGRYWLGRWLKRTQKAFRRTGKLPQEISEATNG
jgi:hypothetical protein